MVSYIDHRLISRKCLVEDGLFEGFEVGSLSGLEFLQGADFFRERIEFFDYFLLFGEGWSRGISGNPQLI